MKLSFLDKLVIRTPRYSNNYIYKHLGVLLKDKALLESLYSASPSLYDHLIKLERGDNLSLKEKGKLEVALKKYITRMTKRCTPFGLFSGCSLITWGNETGILISDGNDILRHSRLDMFYLCKLGHFLSNHADIKSHLTYFSNSSLHKINKKYTYIEYEYDGKRRSNKLNQLESDEYLELVIALTNTGANYQNLVTELLDKDAELETEEVIAYLDELIQSQVILSELEPNVTGDEYLNRILTILESVSSKSISASKALIELRHVQDKLHLLDQNIVNSIDDYRNIMSYLLESFDIDIEEGKLFQIDMSKTVSQKNTIEKRLQNDLEDCVTLLAQFSKVPSNKLLKEFGEKFRKRYEQSEVPLLQVLSPENGLGYPVQDSKVKMPLLENLHVPYQHSLNSNYKLELNPLQKLLFDHIIESGVSDVIRLEELKSLTPMEPHQGFSWPPTFSIMFNLLSDQEGEHFVNFKFAGNHSSSDLLARFAHGNPEINDFVYEIGDLEDNEVKNDDIIIAEIAHLPEDRTGNVILRPSFRKYEIPYLAKSTLDPEHIISLQDIIVFYDGMSQSFKLKSKRFNKEIQVRHSNAYASQNNSHPVFRFLNDLQFQNKISGISFSWGGLQGLFKHLPRVQYKKSILARESWTLNKNDIESLKNDKLDIFEWRNKHSIPETFIVAEGDNEMVIDCSDDLSVKVFLDLIDKKTTVLIYESLFSQYDSPIKDVNESQYVNEIIASCAFKQDKLQGKDREDSNAINSSLSSSSKLTPKYFIGSEWLYLKLYCGIESVDYLVSQKLAPLAESYINSGFANQWFFIRFNDENGFHIRYRICFSKNEYQGNFLQDLNSKLSEQIKQDLIWNIQTETYVRELKRYGGDQSMTLSERIFYYDSASLSVFLDLLNESNSKELRDQFAFASIDSFLNCLGVQKLAEKYTLMESLKNGFGREFGLSVKSFKISLDSKFRSKRKDIQMSLNALLDRTHLITKIVLSRNAMINKEQFTSEQMNSIIPSLLHMHINRLYPTQQRFNEFVLYYCLSKHYASEIAKMKYTKKKEDAEIK